MPATDPAATTGDYILVTEGLTKAFGGFSAVIGRQSEGAARLDPRSHRSQWGGQDDLLQYAHQIPQSDPRTHRL